MTALLEVRDLNTVFSSDQGDISVVNGISFDVHRGHTLAIVGESGCGKSVTSLSIMGLLPKPHGRIARGSIKYEGRELVGAQWHGHDFSRAHDLFESLIYRGGANYRGLAEAPKGQSRAGERHRD
jgi:ABC-type dipeptide/oligopeptide/nickel transport system ATPase component